MLSLPGPAALSEFRRSRLLANLQVQLPQLQTLHARYLHFIDLDGVLDSGQREHLDGLLSYGEAAPDASGGQTVLVVPRFGTISPWSSKATDILHICGLDRVRRVERGIEYRLQADTPLSNGELESVAPLLHDRMTEAFLLDESKAAGLFETHPPAPLGIIPLLAEGPDALIRANRDLGLALSSG
ncbi:MAG TPA: phosphoribosylformylglycinamidine synthase, partial [Chromatiales bacterium]|nr:phosphoribosylformylglycinamidine synthase [Chromatiales bacterium]